MPLNNIVLRGRGFCTSSIAQIIGNVPRLLAGIVDLKKAFDTVDHAILLGKLQKFDIKELEHDWLKSYLANRRQFCRINGVPSKEEEISHGVPQGSCIGPLLFLININDLPFCLQNSEATKYADDTTSSYSSKSVSELNAKLNNDLHCLGEWLHGNKLTINVTKTLAMIVGSRPSRRKIIGNPCEAPCSALGDTNIDILQSTKYLGLILDQYLAWDEHITLLLAKISRSLSFLKYAKKFLPLKVLNFIYKGIVEPHFRYCRSVWGNCVESKKNALQKLQHRAARIV